MCGIDVIEHPGNFVRCLKYIDLYFVSNKHTSQVSSFIERFCSDQGLGLVDKWSQAKPGLLKGDGLHPSCSGALLLSRNIDAN